VYKSVALESDAVVSIERDLTCTRGIFFWVSAIIGWECECLGNRST